MSHKTAATVAHTIGIDTGKNTLQLIGLDDQGAIVLREKIARGRIAARLANVPRCLIGIEAGMATHYVARELGALGHDVKQVPPAYSKPFRQGHKNDFRDAHAIAEAVQRPSTRCVPVKTDDQLDLQALQRVRSRLVGQRTAVINQIGGFLLEHGIAVRQGLRFLRQQLPDILAKRSDVLSPRMIRIMEKRGDHVCRVGCRPGAEEADHRHRRLLRARRNRPRRSRAAEDGDELTLVHSITSPAPVKALPAISNASTPQYGAGGCCAVGFQSRQVGSGSDSAVPRPP